MVPRPPRPPPRSANSAPAARFRATARDPPAIITAKLNHWMAYERGGPLDSSGVGPRPSPAPARRHRIHPRHTWVAPGSPEPFTPVVVAAAGAPATVARGIQGDSAGERERGQRAGGEHDRVAPAALP